MLAINPKAQIAGSTEVNSGLIEIPVGPIDDFDPALWQLLQDIKTAGIPLRGKIAEYAGFYIKVGATTTTEWDPTSDNGVNPDLAQTGASQPNKSLDKLTFLIMFRLPFQGEVVGVTPPLTNPEADLYNNRKIVKKTDDTYVLCAFHENLDKEGKVTSVDPQPCTITRPNPIAGLEIAGKDLFYDGPTSSYYVVNPLYEVNYGTPLPPDPNGTTWSKRANACRAAGGLKLLNGAGEQVALVGGAYKHVDDAGNLVSFEYNVSPTPETANAYVYYEINFGDIYPGRQQAITDQATINAIKTVPLYYFLTVYTENKPQVFDQKAHYPEQLEKDSDQKPIITKAKRPITFGSYSAGLFVASLPQPPDAGLMLQIIFRDSLGRYYVTKAGATVPVYLTEDFAGDEDFTADSFYLTGTLLTGLSVSHKSGKFYAQHPTKLSQARTRWHSGVTFGYGCDAGDNRAAAHVYKVVFTIQKLAGASGTFRLNYEFRTSDPIPFNVTDNALRESLSTLMGIDEDLISISPATALNAGYSAGWTVTIQQRVGQAVNGFRNIYSHELFYHKPAAINILSNSAANPTVVTTATAHGLSTGATVLIANHAGSTPAINGSRVVTVLTPTTFSVPVNVTAGGGASGTVVSEPTARILITPAMDSQRYRERLANELPADTTMHYSAFETLLSSFYFSNDFTNPDPVNDGKHGDDFVLAQFRKALKKIYGLSMGPAWIIYNENRVQFEQFRMPMAKQTLVSTYRNFFSKKYYQQTSTYNIETDKMAAIFAKGGAPNVLEKLLLASISYGGIGKWKRVTYKSDSDGKPVLNKGEPVPGPAITDPAIVLAIASHNQHELKRIFIDRNHELPDRWPFLVGYVESFQHILYRGVEA